LEQEEDEWTAPLQKLQGCYNINVDEDDDPRKVNISEAHEGITRGHYVGKETTQKVLRDGLWWPTLHRDAKDYYRAFDVCQRVRKPSRRDEMTLAPQLTLQAFDKWAIDFMGPINPPGKCIGARYIIIVT
jgi:hypothetical protein